MTTGQHLEVTLLHAEGVEDRAALGSVHCKLSTELAKHSCVSNSHCDPKLDPVRKLAHRGGGALAGNAATALGANFSQGSSSSSRGRILRALIQVWNQVLTFLDVKHEETLLIKVRGAWHLSPPRRALFGLLFTGPLFLLPPRARRATRRCTAPAASSAPASSAGASFCSARWLASARKTCAWPCTTRTAPPRARSSICASSTAPARCPPRPWASSPHTRPPLARRPASRSATRCSTRASAARSRPPAAQPWGPPQSAAAPARSPPAAHAPPSPRPRPSCRLTLTPTAGPSTGAARCSARAPAARPTSPLTGAPTSRWVKRRAVLRRRG